MKTLMGGNGNDPCFQGLRFAEVPKPTKQLKANALENVGSICWARAVLDRNRINEALVLIDQRRPSLLASSKTLDHEVDIVARRRPTPYVRVCRGFLGRSRGFAWYRGGAWTTLRPELLQFAYLPLAWLAGSGSRTTSERIQDFLPTCSADCWHLGPRLYPAACRNSAHPDITLKGCSKGGVARQRTSPSYR